MSVQVIYISFVLYFPMTALNVDAVQEMVILIIAFMCNSAKKKKLQEKSLLQFNFLGIITM